MSGEDRRESGDGVRVTDARVRALIPKGQSGGARLKYVLDALLGRFGVGVSIEGNSGNPGEVRLSCVDGGQGSVVTIDVNRLQSAFQMISGDAESCSERDHLGRVLGAKLARDCSEPVLSEWGRKLATSLFARDPGPRQRKKHFTVYLTHDVDRVHPLEPVGLAGRAVRAIRGLARGSLAGSSEAARWFLGSPRFLETFERIMRMEQQAGAVATYFFMSGPYSVRRYGSRSGRSKRLRRLAAMADRYGHRIGLHGCAYSLARDNYAVQREVLSQAVGREVLWHRNHYLVWDSLRSPGALAKAGIRVDSTCGFHDVNGFRAGVSSPYRLWDFAANAASEVVEIPLVFMDGVCRGPVTTEWDQLYQRIDSTEATGGSVAVLFHIDGFVGSLEAVRRYEELLYRLNRRGADLVGSTFA